MAGCPIPEHAEIQFAVNLRTGTIHIVAYTPGPGEDGYTESELLSFGEGLAAMAATPLKMICGQQLRIAIAGSATRASRGDHTGRPFNDTELCIACVRLMGDQSPRVFEYDEEGDQ